uniref:Reticulon domain-containing protein n=1 Tax=Syphacia muris TaxID=451379 RepID=A0A0N5A8K6_9BILA
MESEDWSESNWITKGIFHVFLFLSRCAIRYTILIGLVASASLALCSSGAFMADVVKKQKVGIELSNTLSCAATVAARAGRALRSVPAKLLSIVVYLLL